MLTWEFTECYNLSPLKEICPQSSSRGTCRRYGFSEKMRIFLLKLVFAFLSKFGTSPRIPAYLNDWDTALLQTFDFTVHDLDGFFNEVELVIDLDFIHGITSVSSDKYFFRFDTLKLSPFAETYHPFPWGHFQQDLVSNLKLERFTPIIGIALLTIASSLNSTLDLNNFLSRFMNDFRSGELAIPNLSPTNGGSTLTTVQCLKGSSFNARVITIVVQKLYQG
ncbi:hypothetical protein Tco_1354734 [Tanacetum coccineum]